MIRVVEVLIINETAVEVIVQHELSAEEARLIYLLFPHLGSLELRVPGCKAKVRRPAPARLPDGAGLVSRGT